MDITTKIPGEVFSYDPYLLATYPIVITLTTVSLVLCTYALWKSRRDIIPLWFVILGLIFTKLGLLLENALILKHEMDGFQPIALLPMVTLKFLYITGTAFQAWGIVISLIHLDVRKTHWWLGVFAVVVALVYWILVLCFRMSTAV